MKRLFDALRAAFRPEGEVTAAQIRQQLRALRQEKARLMASRAAGALDAVGGPVPAERYTQLTAEIRDLDSSIGLLEEALPQAVDRERETAERAEAERRATALVQYRQDTADAARWLDAVLASLPGDAVLTEARDRALALRQQAATLGNWSGDADVRRPLNPLNELVKALELRLARIARARHAPHAPITLGGGASAESMTEAISRVAERAS